jgi:acyl-ACP thioesterase
MLFPMENNNAFTYEYEVRAYEADVTGRASLPALCRYLEDAAGRNAVELGFGMAELSEKNCTWVLSRLHFEITRRPPMNRPVKVQTWPAGTDRLFALREFRLFDEEDNFLMSASSAWMILDLERRRPLRPLPFFENITLPEMEEEPLVPEKLEPPRDRERTGALTVPFSSLDINNHVNNVAYLNWALDSLKQGFLQQNQIIRGDINYLAETFQGDHLEILQSEPEEGVIFLTLVRGETEICHIRLGYVPR